MIMDLPQGISEEEFLRIVDKVAKSLAAGFKFGYHGVEDLEQEARISAIKLMKSYKPERGPLENYLFRSVKNLLINYKRDHFQRKDDPCRNCTHDPDNPNEQKDCKRWNEWNDRNTAKRNLMQPIDVYSVHEDSNDSSMYVDSTVVAEAEFDEIIHKIDRALPVKLRQDYLRMRSGDTKGMTKSRKEEVRAAVSQILGLQPEGTPNGQ